MRDQPLGVLTGGLIVVPAAAEAPLRAIAAARGIAPGRPRFRRPCGLPGLPPRRRHGRSRGRRLVELVTALFLAGEIRVLVGTQALLGEGWMPRRSTVLVLASNSAAFMLSNQMRGRAIRIDPARPGKVANIWHLATVEHVPGSALEALGARLDWGALDQGRS